MGNIEDFAAQLAGDEFQKQLAAENPYFGFQSAPDFVGQSVPALLAKNPKKFNTGEAIALALGSGLLSGGFRAFGDNYQSDLTNRYQDTVKSLAAGEQKSFAKRN
jgi:hypothetical protein